MSVFCGGVKASPRLPGRSACCACSCQNVAAASEFEFSGFVLCVPAFNMTTHVRPFQNLKVVLICLCVIENHIVDRAERTPSIVRAGAPPDNLIPKVTRSARAGSAVNYDLKVVACRRIAMQKKLPVSFKTLWISTTRRVMLTR